MKVYSQEQKLKFCQEYEDQKYGITLKNFLEKNGIDVDYTEFRRWRDELSASIIRQKTYPDEFVKELAMAASSFLNDWLEKAGAPEPVLRLASNSAYLLWKLTEKPIRFSLDEDVNIMVNVSTIINSIYALDANFDLEGSVGFKMLGGEELASMKFEACSMSFKE
jgi:hypothetical protein